MTAMYNFAWMHEQGFGAAQNYDMALTWYRKSAEAGNASAMYQTAYLLVHRFGAEEGYAEAAAQMVAALREGQSTAVAQMTTKSTDWPRPFRRALQSALKENGYYDGIVDGLGHAWADGRRIGIIRVWV